VTSHHSPSSPSRVGIPLASYLARLIWLSLLPLILLAGWLAFEQVRAVQGRIEGQAEHHVRHVVDMVDKYLKSRERGLEMLAQSPMIDDPRRWPDFYQTARGYFTAFGSHVVLADAAEPRPMRLNTRVPFGAPLPTLPRPKGHAAAPAAIASGKVAVGDIFPGPIAREPLIAIAVPVLRDGKATHVLLTAIETRKLREHIDQIDLPSDWSLALLDGKGDTIARRGPALKDVDTRRFTARSDLSSWSAVVGIPDQAYRAPLIGAVAFLATMFLAAILAGYLGGTIAGRRLDRGVATLTGESGPGPAPEITEIASARRRIEDARVAVENSERRFQTTFEQAAVGIAHVAPDGHPIWVNRALEKMFGYGQTEFQTLTWQAVTHPEDLQADVELMWRLQAREIESYSRDKRFIAKDGRIFWASLSVAPVWREGGAAPEFFVATVEDISARKQAESILRDSETLLRQTQRLGKVGSWSWDFRTDTPIWSDEMFRIFGRDPASGPADYKTMPGYLTRESWDRLSAAVERTVVDGMPYELEVQLVGADGERGWAVARGEALRDADGNITELRGMLQDITAAKKAEGALRESEERLRVFIRHAPAALAMFDRDMRHLAVSQRWLDDYHLDGRNILGLSYYEVFPEISDFWKAVHRRSLAGEVVSKDEDCFERLDGGRQWLRWETRPWHDRDSAVGGILIFSEDITARKQAELALAEAQRTNLEEQHQARLAALNLMEDAVAARVRAEAANAALGASESRFRALVEQSLAGIYIIQDGHFRYVNPGFAEIFGYDSPEDLIDDIPVSALVAPEDRDQVTENVRRRLEGEVDDLKYSFVGLRRDGSRIDVEVHGRAFEYEGHHAVIGLVLDITARKATETALRISEKRFHDIVNASVDWVWEVDTQGRYTYVSESVTALLNYTPEELLGKTPFDIMPPEEAARVGAEFAAIATRKEAFRDLDNVCLAKDGTLHHVQTNGTPILGENGELLGYRGLDKDVTDRVKALADLRDSEYRYRLLADNASDWIFWHDANRRYLYVSPTCEPICGYRPEAFMTDPGLMERIIHPDDLALYQRHFGEDGHDEITLDFRILHKDGKPRWIGHRCRALYDESGNYIGRSGSNRDITERKLAEISLRESEDRLRTLVNTIPDLVWMKNPDGVYLACNSRFEQLYGAAEADILGKTDYDFVDRAMADFFRANDCTAITKGGPSINEEELIFASDNHRELVQTIKTPVYDLAGNVLGVLGIARDVTRAKAAEQELERHRNHLEELVAERTADLEKAHHRLSET